MRASDSGGGYTAAKTGKTPPAACNSFSMHKKAAGHIDPLLYALLEELPERTRAFEAGNKSAFFVLDRAVHHAAV